MISKSMVIAAGLIAISSTFAFADDGLITKPSKYSVKDTIEKFEAAIKAKAAGGWVIFSRIDHAAAAKQALDKGYPVWAEALTWGWASPKGL